MPSVLQDWVMELPLREQGVLLAAVRGCDLTPKFPLESVERELVGAIRFAFMVPADPREVDREPGTFMRSNTPVKFKPSALGHYPLHWVAHVMHAAQVIAARHPDHYTRQRFSRVYLAIVDSLHLEPENSSRMAERLSEDRIATGMLVQ